ncbi:sigma-70 family RNA polymerase sigma factor [uncultured Pseudoteredinibacter sp.]|uniref:sigma-70 family RNA polymerase sigma factor n=1 Tax=uncultured Pseudoteredinibacter sp. TaxID=1641701 RepID=UPI00261B16D5|nr:sigma-70 family RNA polymerase sigma factor [uncultured Pseudoteredinibacter sp.]
MGELRLEDFEQYDWDSYLVAVAGTGDRKLFMVFYDHFAPRLRSWLIKLSGDKELAQELSQETFLQAWRRASAFNPEKAKASTWLFTIARNLFVDHKRRQKVEQKHAEKLAIDDVKSYDFGLDDGLIKKAIANLPHQQSQMIYQSYYLGRSHSEIAKASGLPLGTIKSSIRLAFQKLCIELNPS